MTIMLKNNGSNDNNNNNCPWNVSLFFLSLIRSPLFHIQLRYHSTPYSVSLVNVLSLKQENKPPSVIFFSFPFSCLFALFIFFLASFEAKHNAR